jgi:8-oxo-dGTP diphosphatase
MLLTNFSCGAVVYRPAHAASQILLIKQNLKDESWGIPKGRMEPGETYAETAVRETKEEAGIDIKLIMQLPHACIEKKNYRKIIVPFLAVQTCNGELRTDHINSEVSQAAWFDISNLPRIYFHQKSIIDAALIILGY